MPRGKPTPAYKFRLLCKFCNSYASTELLHQGNGAVQLWCRLCGATAEELDEVMNYDLEGKL